MYRNRITGAYAVCGDTRFSVQADRADSHRPVQLGETESRQRAADDSVYSATVVILPRGELGYCFWVIRIHQGIVTRFDALDKGRLAFTIFSIMEPRITAEFYRFLSSPVFLSAFFSWFIAQLLKSVIDAFRNRSRVSRDLAETLLWKTGGMPSSHSSLVTALATSIGFRYGVAQPLFTLALFYGILIIRDALGVRRAAGLQAQALNRLGLELQKRHGVEFTLVKEVNGHTPSEVSVGVLLGFFIAGAFSSL